jgi:hypothetical protein
MVMDSPIIKQVPCQNTLIKISLFNAFSTIHKKGIQYTVSLFVYYLYANFFIVLKQLINIKEILISVFWHGTCFIIGECLCNTVLKECSASLLASEPCNLQEVVGW